MVEVTLIHPLLLEESATGYILNVSCNKLKTHRLERSSD